MTKTEELALRVRVDMDLLDMCQNEITKMRKFLKQEKTPLNPARRSLVFDALNCLQDGPN